MVVVVPMVLVLVMVVPVVVDVVDTVVVVALSIVVENHNKKVSLYSILQIKFPLDLRKLAKKIVK